MLRLMQVINYMFQIGMQEDSIIETFEALESGRLNQTGLYMELGLETPSDAIFERFDECLPKWRSALSVIKMKHE
jgi:hypothetical protein